MAEGRSTDVVPGMAEAIEKRRLELGIRPGQLAELAHVTPQGLVPVRRGYRRQYQDKVKLGLARALQWESDAVDRLLAGQSPAPLRGNSGPDDDPTAPGGATALAELRDQVTRLEAGQERIEEMLKAALSGDARVLFADPDEHDSARPRPPPASGEEGA